MTSEAVDQLRERASDYELNGLAAGERGDASTATAYTTIAIVLREVAEVLEQEAA